MVARWESSTRPLFVKTVWRDGQHHVLLDEDRHSQEETTSSQGSARSHRSVKIAPSPSTKKVSSASVKLLLAGVGSFTPSEQKLLRFKSGSDAIAKKKTSPETAETVVAFKNVRQVLNARPEHNKIPLPAKSNSLDANSERDRVAVSPYISYAACAEPPRDTLSERVMVWLDLAAQNGNGVKEAAVAHYQPQGFVTACRISQKRQHAATKRRSFAESKSSADREEFFHVEGVSRGLRSPRSSVSRDCPSVEEEEESFSEGSRVRAEKHRLSSEVEKNGVVVVTDVRQETGSSAKDSVKRQLHIFMPNLPKKFSDCDSSILSSKLSTGSFQKRPSIVPSKNF